MYSFFQEIGREVLSRWHARDFSLTEFPDIALEVLKERPPSAHVDLDALTRDFLFEEDQPLQTSSGFGQPELIVFDHPRFYIQVLFWLDGTTDIHQHEFSGVFHVLAGSSLHSVYQFENVHPVNAHFRLGDLKLIDTQLLATGRTERIVSGAGHIHSLFHLETPSVTVVVRTRCDPGTSPQFTYLPPHVALDPVQDDALTMRRKQLLDALERVGDPTYLELVLEMIGRLDFERGFFILQNAMTHLRGLGGWVPALEAFMLKHGELAKKVVPTLEEIVKRDELASWRRSIEDVNGRFLLALLMSVPTREKILEMLTQWSSEDAVETLMAIAQEMLEAVDGSVALLDAGWPFDLEMDEEDQPLVLLEGLRHFVTGGPPPEALQDLNKNEMELLMGSFRFTVWEVLRPQKSVPRKRR